MGGPGPQPRGGLSPAVWIPLAYFAVSALWVAVSDDLLTAWAAPDQFESISMLKGWAFLAVSSLGIHLMLRTVLAERQAATERAGQLERRARELVEHSPDAIILVEERRVAYANPAAARLLGAAEPGLLLGRHMLELVDPADHQGVLERQAAVEGQRAFPPVQVRRMRRLDGSLLRAEVAISRVSSAGASAVQVTMRDVTRAWLLQEEVRHVNGALRTLGAVNEALVRAGSEQELMAEVCRIAVELGGYRAAWVAQPREGGAEGLEAVAHHGADEAAMGAAGLDWHQAVRPEGMAATAHRTGQPVVANDLAAEAPAHPYAEAMRGLGWLAAAALPLRHGGEPLGALTLLAGEVDAFDGPVLQLLRQLVDDLAFGLAALRTRAELARQGAFVDAILDHAGVLVGVIGRDGTLVRVNREYERITGFTMEELVGRPVWERLLPPEVAQAYRATFEERRRQPFPQLHRAPLLTRQGEVRQVEWIQTALGGGPGDPAFVVGIGHDVTERTRADLALRASRAQLRALAARLQSVREEEQARVARDLHDELGQLLTGLKMDLRWLERRLSDLPPSPQVNPLVDRVVAASALADQTVASVQRIAAELRPGVLDRLGLVPALRQEVRQFQARTGLSCQARLDETAPEPAKEVATALYRICQEALTNVSRHAGARRVEVSLDAEAGALVLRVVDDGRGFDAEHRGPEALGLLGMTERASLLGGEVVFSPRPGGGTAVTARVPLAADGLEAT